MPLKKRKPIVCMKPDNIANLTTADTRFNRWEHFALSRIILGIQA